MTTEANRLAKSLRIKAGCIAMGEMIAWGSDSFLMDQAAVFVEKQAAEIERLKAENGRWIDLAGHWAQECKTEQRLSFREQVGKLEAEIERKDAMLRQALEAMSGIRDFTDKQLVAKAIAAIKQHLGEHHGN